ncbi:hypothetical protein Sjap_012646 [Stephania japonica]|uniref:GIL1/IRKI C-terminal domain-containing protein n=1 Tax=Stephania japonica TaxID=461633 RepID=A0AAP0IWH5_9MAGN
MGSTGEAVDVSKEEIKDAIAKAVELRALHAALMQGNNSPASLRALPPNCSVSPPASSQYSAQDYPVFTPSYEVEPLPGYHHFQFDNRSVFENCDGSESIGVEDDESCLSDCKKETSSLRRAVPPFLINRESYFCQYEDKSVASSCANHISVLQTSPGGDIVKSSRMRNVSGEFKSVTTTCNKCKPATISSGKTDDNGSKSNNKSWNSMVPHSDSHVSLHPLPKSKAPILSRFFPRLKRKNKSNMSPNRPESEEVSQILKDLGMVSVESLKKELMEAHENRDAALMEVAEMKSSLGELKNKLERLETYCDELKRALKLTVQWKDSQAAERSNSLSKRSGKSSVDEKLDNFIPLRHEVMVEGFLQIVSEARLSVKQFCKTLVGQMEETDHNLIEILNSLLHPYTLSLKSRHTKVVIYHLEALINQSLYQDFENCVFQKNGSPKVLDPQQERKAQFSSFVSLRNLSWNEVLRKGTKYYSEDFSKFCDQKMSCIISTLNWSRPWPEQLLQTFFVAAKCIWLLHLLAFSFNPPLTILRVEENRSFDPLYMEDVSIERHKSQAPIGVRMMVTPGFYVHDKILRCKVLCRYRNVA